MIEGFINLSSQKIRLDIYKKIFMMYNYMKGVANYVFQNKMSMTGSLMGYENNNDVNQAKCKKPLKPLPVVSSISSSGVTTSTTKSRKARKSTRKESCIRGHVNSLWSVWYGILAVAFQAYIAMRYAKRFLGKIANSCFLLPR